MPVNLDNPFVALEILQGEALAAVDIQYPLSEFRYVEKRTREIESIHKLVRTIKETLLSK